MGAEISQPQPGAKLKVIGAGLPRTGTASFSDALSQLLDGPVYHGGAQTLARDDPSQIKAWIDILSRTPYKSAADREYVMKKLPTILDGYVAVTDVPAVMFVEELMEVYPDAKVVITERDREAWTKSMENTANTSLQSYLALMLYWHPTLTHFGRYAIAMNSGRYGELFKAPDQEWSHGAYVWDKHQEYMAQVVPRDKLAYVNVKDGWGPLCEALKVPVPKTEFPRINDAKAMEEFAKTQIQRGLMRWAAVIGSAAVVGAVSWRYWARR